MRAEAGDAAAQYSLGRMYDSGHGILEDDAEAAHWYRRAAEQGHARAQYNLGLRYDFGAGVPEDAAEAVRWYRLAAEQGYPPAKVALGQLQDEAAINIQKIVRGHLVRA